MANLNKSFLIGRLTADPELRHTPQEIPVTSFTIAVDRKTKGQDGKKITDFIDIVAWRVQAEFAAKYFTKGASVFVCGSLQIRTWKDKDGNNRKSAEIIADDVQFAESKKNEGSAAPCEASGNAEDFEEISDNELPF